MKPKDFLYGRAQDVLKRWSRSGIQEFVMQSIGELPSNSKNILVIGGYGPISSFIEREYNEQQITTLDINPDFRPEIVADLASPNLANSINLRFDIIIFIEVLEHISDFGIALQNIKSLLNQGGVLVGTTPWSTPLHDKPLDFFRFTYFQLEKSLLDLGFVDINIECRGNLLDTIIYLGLRGLKSWGLKGKLIFCLFAPISLLMSKPERYIEIQDSCIGYSFIAYKKSH